MHNYESFDSSLSPQSPENSFAPYQMDIPGMVKRSLQEEPSYEPIPLLKRLFPTELERITQENQAKELSSRYVFRQQILNTIGNMICEDLKNQCFHQIKRSEIKLDGETRLIVAREIAQFSLEANRITFEYLRTLGQQIICIEELPDIESKRLMEEQIHKNKFLVCQRLKELVGEFINSICQKYRRWS